MTRCAAVLTALVLGLGAATASAQTTVLKDPANGTPELKSIDAIAFAPGGVLLIGDGKGKQVVAVDTRDATQTPWTKTEMKAIKDDLGGRLGTTGKDIEIVKVAVNPASQTAYLAVRALNMKKDLILTVDGNGKVNEFKLAGVPHIVIPLPADQKVNKVTDIAWGGDRVLVAAQAADTFGSKIFSIPAPLAKDGSCGAYSTETYHVEHGRWETNAPIRTLIPYELNGKKYLVGTFTCTPIVKYALDDLQPGAKVKGVSVIELGYGNEPLSMFTYQKGGKSYILMSHIRKFGAKEDPVGPSPYWTAKVDYEILKETNKINKDALRRTAGKGKASESVTDRAVIVPSFHGVVVMSKLDEERALVIRNNKGAVSLEVVPLP
jgi:hypothetical protein